MAQNENGQWSHERRRPTNREKQEIDLTIKNYFLKGLSAAFVIQKTGLNKNTVYAKYNKLSAAIKDATKADFLKRYEDERVQHIGSLDNLADKLYITLDQVEEQIQAHVKSGSEIPPHLLQKFCEIAKLLFAIIMGKKNTTMNPPIDESIRIKIKEMMENSS